MPCSDPNCPQCQFNSEVRSQLATLLLDSEVTTKDGDFIQGVFSLIFAHEYLMQAPEMEAAVGLDLPHASIADLQLKLLHRFFSEEPHHLSCLYNLTMTLLGMVSKDHLIPKDLIECVIPEGFVRAAVALNSEEAGSAAEIRKESLGFLDDFWQFIRKTSERLEVRVTRDAIQSSRVTKAREWNEASPSRNH